MNGMKDADMECVKDEEDKEYVESEEDDMDKDYD